jgi:hypothetical protein
VARYRLSKTTPDFLARRLLELPATLYDYGFIVTNLGNDGATEIRTATHLLATFTAGDILKPIYTPTELEGLPLDFPIAYQHPSQGCENIKIIFCGDMPHLVKKIRNVFDNKSRTLTYHGRIMKLAMIHDIWKEMETKGPALRKYHFAADHFELDSYKKMRVFLAVQVLSQTTINMITEYCQ